jgi:hypothetical protein
VRLAQQALVSGSTQSISFTERLYPILCLPICVRLVQQALVSGSTQSISFTERLYARPEDIFECFTDERRMKAFTQVRGCFLGHISETNRIH